MGGAISSEADESDLLIRSAPSMNTTVSELLLVGLLLAVVLLSGKV